LILRKDRTNDKREMVGGSNKGCIPRFAFGTGFCRKGTGILVGEGDGPAKMVRLGNGLPFE
jgi:hypothetical protein